MAVYRAVRNQRLPSPSPSLRGSNGAESGHIPANTGLYGHDHDDVDDVFRIDDIVVDNGPSIDNTPEPALLQPWQHH